MNEWAQKEFALLNDLYANKRKLECNIESGITVNCDETALSCILHNLVSNAVKYSPENSTIKVNLSVNKNYLVLNVIDFGMGIPNSEKKNIFNRFYRIENEESRKTKGSGLGLFICKQFSEILKAKLDVYDNMPTGSNFELKIPLTS